MATVHAELKGDKAVLTRKEFERLLELARRSEPVEVQPVNGEREAAFARLAVEGGAFDFWKDAEEEVYSSRDGEAV